MIFHIIYFDLVILYILSAFQFYKGKVCILYDNIVISSKMVGLNKLATIFPVTDLVIF